VKVGKREEVKRRLKGFSVALVMKFCRTRIPNSGDLSRITNFVYQYLLVSTSINRKARWRIARDDSHIYMYVYIIYISQPYIYIHIYIFVCVNSITMFLKSVYKHYTLCETLVPNYLNEAACLLNKGRQNHANGLTGSCLLFAMLPLVYI
jgi:hypothetical protein